MNADALRSLHELEVATYLPAMYELTSIHKHNLQSMTGIGFSSINFLQVLYLLSSPSLLNSFGLVRIMSIIQFSCQDKNTVFFALCSSPRLARLQAIISPVRSTPSKSLASSADSRVCGFKNLSPDTYSHGLLEI